MMIVAKFCVAANLSKRTGQEYPALLIADGMVESPSFYRAGFGRSLSKKQTSQLMRLNDGQGPLI